MIAENNVEKSRKSFNQVNHGSDKGANIIVETDNYPSLRNNNLTIGGYI
jgi:hypothetical protein